MTPKETALTIAKTLDAKKSIDIKVLETADHHPLADYFVICTATLHHPGEGPLRVLREGLMDLEPPHHIEGHRGTWVLLDFSSVVVHIFMDEARKFYDLERLWGDAQSRWTSSGVLTEEPSFADIRARWASRFLLRQNQLILTQRPGAHHEAPGLFAVPDRLDKVQPCSSNR